MSLLNDLTQLFRKDPRPAFHFMVSIGTTFTTKDTSFREVSGISVDMKLDEIKEGGENRFTYQVPLRASGTKLSLKRGIAELNSPLVVWCKKCLETDFDRPIVTKDVTVRLLNQYHLPAAVWNFANAYPVKWEVEGFHSMKNEVAIEKIDMVYTTCTREDMTWL